MRIVALDPGTAETGFLVLSGRTVESAGVLRNSDVLVNLSDGFWSGDLLAVEMIASYGMPVGAEVFETCVWIGRYLQAWSSHRGDTWRLIPRMRVKSHLCHSSRAKDPHVRQALIDRWGAGSERKGGALAGVKSHAWAALGVACVALDEATAPKQAEVFEEVPHA